MIRPFDLVHSQTIVTKYILDSIAAKKAILNSPILLMQISALSKTCADSLLAGGKIIFAGNGGSFADAQHLSAELISRFMFNRSPLPSLVLGANSSSITAIGNDYGYEQVFARELEAVAKIGDVFIPISTSGNSPNILAAVKKANELRLSVIAFTGESGGMMSSLCECLSIPSKDTARIQECHIMVGHIVCGLVEQAIFIPDEL